MARKKESKEKRIALALLGNSRRWANAKRITELLGNKNIQDTRDYCNRLIEKNPLKEKINGLKIYYTQNKFLIRKTSNYRTKIHIKPKKVQKYCLDSYKLSDYILGEVIISKGVDDAYIQVDQETRKLMRAFIENGFRCIMKEYDRKEKDLKKKIDWYVNNKEAIEKEKCIKELGNLRLSRLILIQTLYNSSLFDNNQKIIPLDLLNRIKSLRERNELVYEEVVEQI